MKTMKTMKNPRVAKGTIFQHNFEEYIIQMLMIAQKHFKS